MSDLRVGVERTVLKVVYIGLLLSCFVAGQERLLLKNREIDTSLGGVAGLNPMSGGVALAADAARVHLLLQFNSAPNDQQATLLQERGGVVTGYVHENGWIVSLPADASLEGLDLRWSGILEPGDKVSSELLQSGAEARVVVEFHSDVDMPLVRQLVLSLGGELIENPDLLSKHLLARLSASRILELAADDRVAYVFPAADDLLQGRPLVACESALTSAGSAGQYIAKVGDGWDGPGLGQASITYTFGDMSQRLPAAATQAEIVRALGEWSKVAAVTFQPGSDVGARQNINIRFARRDHGDGYAFDGGGGTLAHTFYPSPPNPEPLAGDMHFDDEERWQIGADIDLFSVALHELGHALGLGHSDRPGAVMYPYYQRNGVLSAEDIGAIQSLYAAPAAAPPTTPVSPSGPDPLTLTVSTVPSTTTDSAVTIVGGTSGGAADPVVTWWSSRGLTGTASGSRSWSFSVALLVGTNSITITAADGQSTSAVRTVTIVRASPTAPPVVPPVTPALPPVITVSYPGPAGVYTTTSASMNLKGTASYVTGTMRKVEWSNARGGGGTATGTSTWETGAIALAEGANSVTLTATGGDGAVGTATIQITYSRGSKDVAAPTLTIISPGGTSMVTSAPSIVVKGNATDNTGVTLVTWWTSAGQSGNATGTSNWETPAIPLSPGYTTVSIRAFDSSGNSAWRTVQVTRR